ncbi:hypothetical protein KAT42_03965, partial [Candidatus Bathyarchaeota archaeon]|nr:hypothetical protein [Candidatus Bathyarchaeota archaeon]
SPKGTTGNPAKNCVEIAFKQDGEVVNTIYSCCKSTRARRVFSFRSTSVVSNTTLRKASTD